MGITIRDHLQDEKSMKNQILVAKREINQRLSSKGFRVATVITMVSALLYIVVPHLRSSGSSSRVIATVRSPNLVKGAFNNLSGVTEIHFTFEQLDNTSLLKSEVLSGKVFIGVLSNGSFVVKSSSTQDQANVIANQVAREIGTISAYRNANLSQMQLRIISQPISPKVSYLQTQKSPSTTTIKASYFELILMYVLLSQYGAWVMLGVIEEKSTRVIEVLLSVIEPNELLAGKVIGIGVVALIHASLLLASLVAGLYIIGSSPQTLISGSLILTGSAYFIIGYAFYCTIFAAVGSTVSRTEDAQAVSFPVALPMLIGYVLGFISIAQTTPSLLIKLGALLPGISPFLAPVLFALGSISFNYLVLSMMISVLSTLFMLKLASKIYRASILKTGSRVRLAAIFRQAT